jgi:SAM-dependent methyltransferase
MESKKYINIIKHYEGCLDKYGDSNKGVDWPIPEDASVRYQIMLELIKEKETVHLLDFGCGAAHLYEYMVKHKKKYEHIDYSGSDISSKFIKLCQNKYPELEFLCFDILDDSSSQPNNFDYAILNGVFTEKQNLSFDEMWDYCKKVLSKIFEKIDKGIAFNVMSKAVDWEREDLFHLPTDLLIDFMTKNLSRNFVIRNDYGLYEYTVYLYKK